MLPHSLITQAYAAFNQRNIDGAFALSEFDPCVEPVEIIACEDGKIEVKVHQLVKSLSGETLSDSYVYHVHLLINGLIERMDFKESEGSSAPSAAFAHRD